MVSLVAHIDVAGDVVDILEDLLLPLGIAPAEIDVEQDDHNALCAAQPGAEEGGGNGKQHQTDKIEAENRAPVTGTASFPHRKTPFPPHVRPVSKEIAYPEGGGGTWSCRTESHKP